MPPSLWSSLTSTFRQRRQSTRKQRSNRPPAVELLEDRSLPSATVLDLNAGSGSSRPYWLTQAGGTVYFSADHPTQGRELWKFDAATGTAAVLKDVRPGSAGSSPFLQTDVNGTLFFVADDGTHGPELWKSDGTTAGTVLVKDITPGRGSSRIPLELTNVNGTLYFTADDGTHGRELWKSDGTAVGTVMVSDVNAGPNGSRPSALFVAGDEVYFVAGTGLNGDADVELWKSDGTAAGTVRVKDISPGTGGAFGQYPEPSFALLDGTLLFAADDGTNGTELWKTDGTAAGTVLVKDINGSATGSSPRDLTPFGGALYFSADDGLHGRELWKTDGTAAGTVLVKDVVEGSGPGSPAEFVEVNGTLFFRGGGESFSAITDVELWKTDGTAAGTVQVKDINPGDSVFYPWGAEGSSPEALAEAGGYLFFVADDGDHGYELWRSDGTAAGTVLVQDVRTGGPDGAARPASLFAFDGQVFFGADNGVSGEELWHLVVAGQPIAVGESYSTDEDERLTVSGPGVLANDSDPDGDPLTAVLADRPSHGEVTLNADGSFTYTPDADFVGTDWFTYTASNGDTLSNVAVVTITVDPLDDAPVAADDTFRVTPGVVPGVAAPGVLRNDSDPEDDDLTAVLVAGPEHGTLTLNADGSFEYVVDDDFTGTTDSFTYRVSDGSLESGVATVTLRMNTPPVGTADAYVVLQDDSISVPAAEGLLSNDGDADGDTLFAQPVDDPEHGSVFFNGDGSFNYLPEFGFHGPDTFTYRPHDGAAPGEVVTVSITVMPRPVAEHDFYRFLWNTTLSVSADDGALANDSSPNGRPFTATVEFGPDHGTLTFNADGSFVYVPNPGFSGGDSFAYTIHDGVAESHRAYVSFEVVTPALARNDNYGEVNAGETVDVGGTGVLANDRDSFNLPLTAVLVETPAHGTLTLNEDGSFHYVAGASFPGEDHFTYKVNNGYADSAPATVILSSSVFVPLNPELEYGLYHDLYGSWILTVQSYGDGGTPTFGFFDTGSGAITFSAYEQAGIPIKVVSGAVSQGVGGTIVGDVSMPGTVVVDGLHAAIATGEDGLPYVVFNLGDGAVSLPGVQAFVGTEAGSPYLPTITGTPILNPTEANPNGLAAWIDMRGVVLDFRALEPDSIPLEFADLHFVSPDTELTAGDNTTAPVSISLTVVGQDNSANPGDSVTLSPTPFVDNVRLTRQGESLTGRRMLFDTGAQMTILSRSAALALGVDLDDPDLFGEVVGVGGVEEEIAGYVLDELTVPTADGREVRFTDVPVFVLDLGAGLGGIIGTNLFNTASTLLYNPFDPSGPSLGVTFYKDLDRGEVGTTVIPLELLEALGGSFVGAVQGQNLPGFQFNANEVSGRVFRDRNRNGRIDRGERGLAGQTVFLDANGNGRLDRRERRTTTDAKGRYALTGLATGTYTVRLVVPRGGRETTRDLVKVTVRRNTEATGLNLGLVLPGGKKS